MRCDALLRNRRPSAAIAVQSANLRCQTPLEASVSESQVHRYAGWVPAVEVYPVVEVERVPAYPVLLSVARKFADDDPACDFSEKNRLIGVYNGCTQYSPA